MENNKKKMNIIDLIALIVLVLVIGFGAYKISGIKSEKNNEVKANIVYTVEITNKDPKIVNYIKAGDVVFDMNSEQNIGAVLDVMQKPYKVESENKESKKIVTEEVPGKITLNVKISSDAKKGKNEELTINRVNILIGKTFEMSIGDSYVVGTIVDIQDMGEEKEAQE